jgi:hypothetical protein
MGLLESLRIRPRPGQLQRSKQQRHVTGKGVWHSVVASPVRSESEVTAASCTIGVLWIGDGPTRAEDSTKHPRSCFPHLAANRITDCWARDRRLTFHIPFSSPVPFPRYVGLRRIHTNDAPLGNNRCIAQAVSRDRGAEQIFMQSADASGQCDLSLFLSSIATAPLSSAARFHLVGNRVAGITATRGSS